MGQIFTGEIFRVNSTGMLIQGVVSYYHSQNYITFSLEYFLKRYSSEPPLPLFKGGGVNFNYLLRRENLKI